MKCDTTLMFNDRPGFRTSSALEWQPWNARLGEPHQLKAKSTVFMDSHFYDYAAMSRQRRHSEIHRWVRECHEVRGQAAVLWHPHTLSQDYGWSDGFDYTLAALKEAEL